MPIVSHSNASNFFSSSENALWYSDSENGIEFKDGLADRVVRGRFAAGDEDVEAADGAFENISIKDRWRLVAPVSVFVSPAGDFAVAPALSVAVVVVAAAAVRSLTAVGATFSCEVLAGPSRSSRYTTDPCFDIFRVFCVEGGLAATQRAEGGQDVAVDNEEAGN